MTASTIAAAGRGKRISTVGKPQPRKSSGALDTAPMSQTLTQANVSWVKGRLPPKANRKAKRDCDFALYCERNLVERFFNKIKHYRAIATRHDKLARNFLAAVQLVAAIILLN